MSLHYSVEKNPVKPGSYRAVLRTSRKASFEQFLDFCSEVSTVNQADAVAVVRCMSDWIVNRVRHGREADFGLLGQTRLGMKADIQSYGDPLTPKDYTITLGWEASRKLKKWVDNEAKKSGVTPHVEPLSAPIVKRVTDMMSNAEDVYVPKGLLEVRGVRLKFDPDRPDEGVFFKPRRGTEVRAQQYHYIAVRTIRLIVPEQLSGTQELMVRSRGRRKGGSPRVGRYPEEVRRARGQKR